MFGFLNMTAEGRAYFQALKQLEDLEIHVGFQGDEAYEDGTTVAEIAAYNELGTSTIPARPFMKRSFEDHEDKLQTYCDHGINALSNGGTAEQALKLIGDEVVGLIQEEIKNGDWEPNSPVTIALKKSEHPLIDTGYMRGQVNFVVKKKGS